MGEDTINVTEAFTVFEVDEVRLFEKVAARARELSECTFYQGQLRLNVRGGQGHPPGLHTEVTHPGKDSLAEMLRLMRPFYTKLDRWFSHTNQILRGALRLTG